jgi:hypothetical protein
MCSPTARIAWLRPKRIGPLTSSRYFVLDLGFLQVHPIEDKSPVLFLSTRTADARMIVLNACSQQLIKSIDQRV